MYKNNHKKRIMFFLYSLSGGGAERTVINIMNNLDKNKYELILVLGTDKNDDYKGLLNNNIKIKILNSKKLRYSLFKLRRMIIDENPDLLFSTINSNNIMMILSKLLTFKKIPVIVREANNRTASGKVTILNKNITRILYNNFASAVVALSNGVKEDLTENFSINKEKISVIYNPIEVEKIKDMSSEKIEDLEFAGEQKVIVSVGRLVEQKNFPLLFNAFKKVKESIDCKLVIVGKGHLEQSLKNLSEELGVFDDVIFLGFKENPYKYMKMADVFVLSSKWEGFGHVIVEAMATGTPVISTDCKSGPSEIIEDNKYGVLVPVENPRILAEKMVELLNNDSLREKYIELGYERAQHFKASEITKEYEKIFDEIILSK